MKQVFCFLICLCTVSVAFSLPKPQKKTQVKEIPPQCIDPTFACQDLENARLCGVVKSCIHDVWATMSAPDDNDDICSLCKEMVKEARDQLLSNMTQEEIKEVFEGSCQLLPVKLISDACIKLVDQFIPELVEMLSSRMDPTMVCTVAGLCNLVHLPIQTNNNVGDDLTCQFCDSVLEHIKEMIITNTTEEEFRTALLNFCTHVGRFSDKCTEAVNDYFDMLYDFIKQFDAKGFCTLIGLCQNGVSSNIAPLVKIFPPGTSPKRIPLVKLLPSLPVRKEGFSEPLVKIIPSMPISKNSHKAYSKMDSNDIFESSEGSHLPLEGLSHPLITLDYNLECPFCKAISFFLKTDLNGDRSQNGVKDALANVCGKWLEEYPDHCASFIQKYSENLQSLITENTDFDTVCFAAKACPLEVKDKLGVSVRVVAATNDTVLCNLCKEAFNEIEKILKDPETKASAEDVLDNLCNLCTEKEKCKDGINAHIDSILSHIEQAIEGDRICPALHLCPSGLRMTTNRYFNNVECDLCKDLIQRLIDELQDPQVKDSVKQLMEKGCDILPQELASQCKTFVEQHFDVIIQMLVGTLNPEISCASMNICPESKKMVMPKVKDMECDLCKEVVQNLENEIKDPKTEDQIKAVLDKACSYLPSSLATQCKTFVDTYTETIITLITTEIDPDTICAALKVCTESKKVVIPKVKDMECDICKEVIQTLESEIKDPKTEDQIKAVLDKVCSYLPSSLATQCKTFVDTYTETIITLIMTEIDPDTICAALKVCAESKMVVIPKIKDMECDVCKEIIQTLENEIKDQRTEAQIKAALDKVCSYLPSSFATQCKTFVDTYTETIITLLMEEIDPDTICEALKVCKESKKVVIPKVKDMECDICKEVIQTLESEIKDPKTEEQIKAVLDKVCSYLPSSLATQCKTFVDTYTETIITLIMTEIDPNTVCAALKVCAGSRREVKISKWMNMECDLCKDIVEIVEKDLKDKKTEDAIRNALENVCSYFPSSFSERCKTFVDSYIETLITLLANESDPSVVCAALNACPSKSGQYWKFQPKAQNLKCEGCQYFLHFVQNQLVDNKIQTELKIFLKKVCGVLPKFYTDNCIAFLDEYGSSLLVLIAQELDPSLVCPEFGMCPSTVKNMTKYSELKLKSVYFDECQLCTTIVDYIDQLLERDDVDKEITQVVEKVCAIIPGSVKDRCASVIETYGPYILQMIGQIANSRQLCQDIDLCERPAGHVHLLGGQKCTFGPSYWCRSKAHASACKAEAYCTTMLKN